MQIGQSGSLDTGTQIRADPFADLEFWRYRKTVEKVGILIIVAEIDIRTGTGSDKPIIPKPVLKEGGTMCRFRTVALFFLGLRKLHDA